MHIVGSSSFECSQNWLLRTKKTRRGSNWNAEYDFKKGLDIFDALGKIHRMYTIVSGMLRWSVKPSRS